ncbi:glycosyltransferase [uncultured Duncaniella sp.]|uniref:glycosyltransferase n=2 Tax=uncultured Duncaniella sp. TaxID=2768039 RepID=UPI002636A9ED|nr:glycosyltransferase [uncultured Duncaniella sp.]
MRKILIISFTSGQKYTGGLQCSRRNIESIEKIFGRENVITHIIEPYPVKRNFKIILRRAFDALHGYMGGMNSSLKRYLLRTIDEKGITDVFIDSSLLGSFAKSVKKRFKDVRVITFFHNIEKEFIRDFINVNRDYFRWYWIPSTDHNEKCAVKYSDEIIALNQRDAKSIKKYYGRDPRFLIPITLRENTSPIRNASLPNERTKALFIGSYFFANVQGITWFVSNVLPHINIKLNIVGASMDLLPKEIVENEKIEVHSNVPDLAPFYEDADFVILPIFSGSGMKVKTAESLMHGKYIIGSQEAFTGYDMSADEATECNTAEEFISAINSFSRPTKFNKASYDLYLEKYSFESSLKLFKKALNF